MRPVAAWLVPASLLSLLSLLALSACGGGDPSPSASAGTSTASAATTTPSPTPTTTPAGFAATAVAAGDQHACALAPDASAWCWGYNRFGQLGDGTTTSSRSPVAVTGGTKFAALVAGRYFSCGLTSAGAALCWGDNSSGQLGNGRTGKGSASANTSAPVAVLGGHVFTSLVAGQAHACGLVGPGQAFCWGAYASGQLGNAAAAAQTVPGRSAAALTFTSLAPGGDVNACGIATNAVTWCWGNNTFGQLGNGSVSNAPQPTPSRVSGGAGLKAVALGRTHTCALRADGSAVCWGRNDKGQLGDGTTTARTIATPVLAGDLRFALVTANDAFTCALTTAAKAYCWGGNDFGQLGTGAMGGTSVEPAAVATTETFSSLSAGEEFVCGVTTGGRTLCWGSNRSGWLGTGTEAASATPVPVATA